MRHRLNWLLLCLLGTVGGCAVSLPQPQLAQLVPKETVWQTPLPMATHLAEQQVWWQSWQDPVLNTLLNAAQQANPTLELAEARIREARAKAYATKAYLWPTVGATASGSRNNNTMLTPAQPINMGSVGLDASWEIDLWGGVRTAEKNLLANLSAKTIEWQDARATVAAEVANAYVALRAYQALAEIVAQDLKSRDHSLQLTQEKEQVGLASPVDVALLDASSADALAQWLETQEGIGMAKQVLVALTGWSAQQVNAQLEQGAARLPQPVGFVLDALPANVITQRYDIRVAAENVNMAAAEVGISKVAQLPSLSLLGVISLGQQEVGSLSINGNAWSFGPTLKLPIFNAGRLKSEEAAAVARYDQALAAYQQKVRFAVREVEQIVLQLDGNQRRIAAMQRSVAGYQQQQDASNAMWQAGSASLLDLEVSRRFLLGSQVKQMALQRDQLSLWIALYKAVGGQWPVDGIGDEVAAK
ncbi:efflux transporter outer membrane subunit [uncultured Deefgea sp.]|uniref:efflux transporter outer membrane subunit n=1 Tax=uncultured Deefgea sp. TaxID=1304914 RepID=UPI002628B7A4|nr:efflux transporter outer membrane subunit [uncultured Deefgea sp.]